MSLFLFFIIDTMDNWDQEKLEEVVKSKSGKQPPTDIVCKHFLEAIENNKYGWFWECPNGGKKQIKKETVWRD